MEKNHTVYRRRRTPCRHRCGAPVCGQRHPFRPLFRLTGSDPLVLGAALYGWGMGCWLGLVFGAVALLSGDAGLFLAADPRGAIVTVLSKGIACGAAAGLCCRWLHPWYPRLSILLSALTAPLVNTGVFLPGCRLFFMPLIHQWAQQAGYTGAGAI